jgi:hypothetical protein
MKKAAGLNDFLAEEKYDFISHHDKAFIRGFTAEMTRLGYDFGGKIGSGYCWGKYMLIYRKTGVKSQNVYARIYIRDASIVLRLFLNQVDKHRKYIENSPSHIKHVFAGPYGDCKHCHNDKDGRCMFRKIYTLEDRVIEKCNGSTFEFYNPGINQLPDFMALFTEFFPKKR